jgi:hypothetical protein
MWDRSQNPRKTGLQLSKRRISWGAQMSVRDSWTFFSHRVVRDDHFEFVVAAMIFANAFVLCFEVQYEGLELGFDLRYEGCRRSATETWPGAGVVFLAFDWFFGVLFFAEAVLKISCFGKSYFQEAWNWLDLTCLLTFVIDKLTIPLGVDVKMLRLVRLCRLLRLTELLRTMEALDVLFVMFTAIKGTFAILAWAVALLSAMLMTVALFLCTTLQVTYFNNVNAHTLSEADLQTHRKLYEYFGTFTRCMLSMFELTLANWPPVTRMLAEEVSEWFMLFCLFHKLTIGFAVIGVINGVILQETFKVASSDDMIMLRQKSRATATMKKKMTLLFETLNHDGEDIDFEEFCLIAEDPEIKTWLASMDIETDDLSTLFKLIDHTNDGQISLDELLTRVPRIKGAARSIDLMALTHGLCNNKVVISPQTSHFRDLGPTLVSPGCQAVNSPPSPIFRESGPELVSRGCDFHTQLAI